MNKETQYDILVELVKEEAGNLKKYAKEIELQHILFSELDCDSVTDCIYGQMTDSCYSERADELITKCCSRVYSPSITYITDSTLNGKPTGNRKEALSYQPNYWSPIEVFISFKNNKINGNNEQLVKYLRGEIDELNFV